MEVAMENASNESSADATAAPNPDESPSSTQAEQKKPKKEERVKRDDRNVEQFMKSLNSVPSLEEKLSLVCKKYIQTADDNKKLQFYIKQSDKRHAMLVKAKEQQQYEYNKNVLIKSKLENLCRELQKQNKAIKEESLLKIREEEEKRKETQAKFQATLTEITALLQQNNEKNNKLRDDNISMTEKFKGVVQQYQLREQQVDKMAKQMALESQLSEAKLQKASLEFQAEKNRLLADMEQLKMENAQYQVKIQELQATEQALRNQIDIYTDKYDEFHTAFAKSNQVFGGFKGEMEKMSKKIQKLEKESLSWKKKWETSQGALINMCTERQTLEERANSANKHLHHMQGLCRTLQAERSVLLATLKQHDIERPPLPALTPIPPPPPANGNAKVDAMVANCAQLKQSLAHLQNQLNVLTTQKEGEKENSPKPEKKKSKSKKNKGEKNQTNDENKNENEKIEVVNAEVTENENAIENLIEIVKQATIKISNENDVDEIKDDTIASNAQNNDTDDIKVVENDAPRVDNDVTQDLNESLVDPASNDEVSHIPEVKSILVQNDVSS